ncbi:GH35 family endo-1,4-beta-xylanase [Microbacterium sp. AK009]|uniref:endo-1,4-beta-xylanase n=1 Tax=Microbacterium sp. AK009 TaxID=2723068 RepID=UPI0015CE1FA8|nr:endo-1,4-beta-xylanase [Microbacterium sp. AK009]NYF17500.1 GH35 family endo-1,4-beta-xylanase [Microbacterium sp. AK009]
MHTVAPPAVALGAAPAHRLGEAVLTVVDVDDQPVADAEVTVAQTRHEFAFGNTGFDVGDGDDLTGEWQLTAAEAELWLQIHNAATLPFYWGRFEPVRGAPRTDEMRRTAQWLRRHGVALKGHPLVWHTVTAPWLLDLELDEIERVQRERIRRDVADFAGLVDTWDAINETVIMPVFDNGDNGITRLAKDRGRLAMLRLAFEEARETNPNAVLLVNDFDLSPAYERVIDEMLEAGIRPDAIGLQTHMHQGYRGEEEILAVADRFARFGLPLHFTETTLLSGDLMPSEIDDLNDYQVTSWPSTAEGEARQADEIERHYRSLVSHPAVEAITYWGFSDRGMWLGAPGGLVRADGSPKPAYEALHRLIADEWWVSPATVRTDAEGRVRLSGFRGDYEVAVPGQPAVPLTIGREGLHETVRTAPH